MHVSQAAQKRERMARAEERRVSSAALVARALALKRQQSAAVRVRVGLECREAARVRKRAARARRKVRSRQQLAQRKQAAVRKDVVTAATALKVQHVGALTILRLCAGLLQPHPRGEL